MTKGRGKWHKKKKINNFDVTTRNEEINKYSLNLLFD